MTLVIATRNSHKVEEIQDILGDQFNYLSLNDLPGAPDVIENAGSFAGNATKKAVELANWLTSRRIIDSTGKQGQNAWVLSDDSGLEVDALGGAPGVHSARFAALDTGRAGNALPSENNAKLLRLLHGVPLAQRTARFRCVLAVAPVPPPPAPSTGRAADTEEPDHRVHLFEGACEGRIATAPSGQGGFGYDPLFTPAGFTRTFAELGEAVKNEFSHRARALAKARLWLEGLGRLP